MNSLLVGCEFTFFRDVDTGKATEWLSALRRPSTVQIPEGDSFTPSAVANFLGITVDGLRKYLKRHRLEATGNGKARRLSRSTVAVLVEKVKRGTAPATINHYVWAVRGFFHWLGRSKQIGRNPLEMLGYTDARTDVRHARRELTAGELQRLFVATRSSERTFRGLAGMDSSICT